MTVFIISTVVAILSVVLSPRLHYSEKQITSTSVDLNKVQIEIRKGGSIMKGNQEMLEHGSFRSLLVRLSVPSVVIMLVMVVYNMADTYFIGQTGDPDRIAALSLCAPIFTVLSGLSTLLGSGGCIVISLALGSKNRDDIRKCTSFCFLGSLVIGFLFTGVMLAAMRPICYALGADSSTYAFTVRYLRVILPAAPIIMFDNVFCNIVRSDGSAVVSMIANVLGTVSNIVLDAVFILVLDWDVAGAAAATVIGNILTCVFLLVYILRKQSFISLNLRYLDLKSSVCLRSITLGLPLACSTLLMSISTMISNRRMIRYGSTALAAQGVAGKISMLTTMIIMGLCMGLQPVISYTYGNKNFQRMRAILKQTILTTVIIGTALSLACFAARRAIISAFIDNADVIRNGQIMIIASLLTGPFYGIYQTCQVYLQSTGQAAYATLTSVLDKGVYFLPILFILEHFFGMYGIAFTAAVTLIFSTATALFLSRKAQRRQGICAIKAESSL